MESESNNENNTVLSEEVEGETGEYGQELFDLIETIDEKQGAYCCGEVLQDSVNPGLEIEGLGLIGLPLNALLAKELAKICTLAPFGKKDATIYDTSVRNTLQLSPSKISFSNPNWKTSVDNIVKRVADELGLKSPPNYSLYKLLLYESGSFFKPHRDTEKEDKMFATLVIQLPSKYEGGQLIVKHNNQTKEFDFSKDAFNISYTAFYADCEHEVKPVTSGYRICLVYNLIHADNSPLPSLADNSETLEELISILKRWKNDKQDAPLKYALLLDFHYTAASLSFHQLKSKGSICPFHDSFVDRIKCQLLKDACQAAGIVIHLALLSIYEYGPAEGGYPPKKKEDPEDWWMTEAIESSITVDHWINAEDKIDHIGTMEFILSDEVQPEPQDVIEPQKRELEINYGNEGAFMKYWYRHAVVVLWPQEYDTMVRSFSDQKACIQMLQGKVKQLSKANFSDKSMSYQCKQLIRAMLKRQTQTGEEVLILGRLALKLKYFAAVPLIVEMEKYNVMQRHRAGIERFMVEAFKVFGTKFFYSDKIKTKVKHLDLANIKEMLEHVKSANNNENSNNQTNATEAKNILDNILAFKIDELSQYSNVTAFQQIISTIEVTNDEKLQNTLIKKLISFPVELKRTKITPALVDLFQSGNTGTIFSSIRDHCIQLFEERTKNVSQQTSARNEDLAALEKLKQIQSGEPQPKKAKTDPIVIL